MIRKIFLLYFILILVIPFVQSFEEPFSVGDNVQVTVFRATIIQNISLSLQDVISFNDNLIISTINYTVNETKISSVYQNTTLTHTPSNSISSHNYIIISIFSFFFILIILLLIYFFIKLYNSILKRNVIFLIVFSILLFVIYLFFINFIQSVSINNISQSNISSLNSGSDVTLGVSDNIDVKITRTRWYGKIIETNNLKNLYLFYIIKLPIELTYLFIYVIVLILIIILFFMINRTKTQIERGQVSDEQVH